MSYNSGKYNTRHSGRYNTPGQFVPGGELPGAPGGRVGGAGPAQHVAAAPAPHYTPQQRNSFSSQQQQLQQQVTYTPTPARNSNSNLTTPQSTDIDMKSEPAASETPSESGDTAGRPYWMKSKLAGVKKLSNKERRRRQNETLRRLLTPKNALMVLNEMMPSEQVNNQFKVEPAHQFNNQYFSKNSSQHNFCADLTLDGNTYKGYGENKMTARNAAAEQAIRDLIIKKLARAAESAAAPPPPPPPPPLPGANPAAPDEEEAEEALPMIQLASFALHKLFSEWEYEGHKVPQLKPLSASISESEPGAAAAGAGVGAGPGVGPGAGAGRRAPAPSSKPPKQLPVNAGALHPCMLLTYMRPQLEYRELATEGDRPQNMLFTLGVDVDGATYIGKAANKKEARKMAAKAACAALWGVQFEAAPSASAPQPPQPPLPQPPQPPQLPQLAA